MRCFFDGAPIANAPATSQRLSNIPVSIPAEILALGPSCVYSPPQLKRVIVSIVRIRLDSRKSMRCFKAIICVHVCEFESFSIGAGWCQALSDAPSI